MPVGDTLKLTPHETLTIKRAESGLLEVEGEYGASDRPPPAHLHPQQDEHFQVVSGSLLARVDRKERKLSAGDSLDIPRGTVHQMWNAGPGEARVVWQTKPAGRTEQWWRAIDRSIREKGSLPGPLEFGVLLTEYRDVFRLASGPDWLLRPALGALSGVGRLRGHRRP